ncbi:hypothetical protein Bca52824_029593 [Brassica carinata]|uniref:Uncharacterized protein n=1 Tax=Brassica carinata TaxID=52824 RepID=A0A8X7VE87_BRACI|nr:hypothetical protein Bca52824_029593 [Brassica carinata]
MSVQYPRQPEADDGIPTTCYCGAQPILGCSYTPKDPYRRGNLGILRSKVMRVVSSLTLRRRNCCKGFKREWRPSGFSVIRVRRRHVNQVTGAFRGVKVTGSSTKSRVLQFLFLSYK